MFTLTQFCKPGERARNQLKRAMPFDLCNGFLNKELDLSGGCAHQTVASGDTGWMNS